MVSSQNLETLIIDHSKQMSDQMVQIASWADSEEDIRYECNKMIDEFLAKAGIKIKGRHEYGLAGGRIDSKYGGVIIEYKYSKGADRITRDPNAHGTRSVVKQIKQRFEDFKKEERIEPNRLFAVGCDGNTLVFVRHRGGKFEVEDPQPATSHTLERLLRALVSLGAQGKSFKPEWLVDDFGAESELAQKGIREVYHVIMETKNKKAKSFFNQWKILFGEVCGYDVEGKDEKVRKLAEHYGVPDGARPAELLFSVHTYYAIFMKFLAAEIASSFSPLGASVLKRCVSTPTATKLRREMENLEQGGIWSQLGITNFLEGDLFSWYLAAWNDPIAQVVRDIVSTLDQYDPTTLSVEPAESRDLLKKLYQQLFPKSVRHDLGEYYTPDWLAEHVLNELGYDGNPDSRLLDPGCGSGTFLVMAINRIKSWFEEHRHECGYGEKELINKILNNIIGFDLNPLAVMASRTNYLLAVRDLLKFSSSVELPVYLCDSIMTPAEYGDLFTGSLGNVRRLRTSAGDFLIPTEITTSRDHIGKYAEMLEICVRNKYDADDFIARCLEEGLPITEQRLHRDLYLTLQELDADNQNGIWARIIKNAFAPLFVAPVEYVAGNPPWINWENLPEGYKADVKSTMKGYGLMSGKGWSAKLGSAKYDLSMLFVYAGIDMYLLPTGSLGFVITQSVFQSDAGAGFRKFYIPSGEKRIHFQPTSVHDMTSFQPFEGASNRTSTVVFRKNKKPRYPVQYEIWSCTRPVHPDMPLGEVIDSVSIAKHKATPIDPEDTSSRWFLGGDKVSEAIAKILGKSDYIAKMGSNTEGANGVYWVEILHKVSENSVLVKNIIKGLKRPVPAVSMKIEGSFLKPLLRSGDVGRWHFSIEAYLIFMSKHLANEITERRLKSTFPNLYNYFSQFREVLETRKSFAGKMKSQGFPFYTMYGSKNMLAPYKVIWNRMGSTVNALVVAEYKDRFLGKVSPVPQETLIYVPLQEKRPAHYLCAMLNSSLANAAVKRYSLVGSKSFASVHLLNNINIPAFDEGNKTHELLSQLSMKCHAAAMNGDNGTISALEPEIDRAAAKLWSITEGELMVIQNELKKVSSIRKKPARKKL